MPGTFMVGEEADREQVLAVMERYGELDGSIVHAYATAFAALASGLSSSQQTELEGLRTDLGVSAPDGAYLYSEPIAMPEIPSADFLFDGDQSAGPTYTYWVELVANLYGKHGSRWRTDLAIRNASGDEAEVELLLHAAGEAYSLTNVIQGSSQAVFEDVVGLLGVTGKGALEIRSNQPMAAVARTYNQTD
ncbi:MAG: hypothetical protein GY906_29430, partial [bacterium]|nr:hypothetical protein [bacterium]